MALGMEVLCGSVVVVSVGNLWFGVTMYLLKMELVIGDNIFFQRESLSNMIM